MLLLHGMNLPVKQKHEEMDFRWRTDAIDQSAVASELAAYPRPSAAIFLSVKPPTTSFMPTAFHC